MSVMHLVVFINYTNASSGYLKMSVSVRACACVHTCPCESVNLHCESVHFLFLILWPHLVERIATRSHFSICWKSAPSLSIQAFKRRARFFVIALPTKSHENTLNDAMKQQHRQQQSAHLQMWNQWRCNAKPWTHNKNATKLQQRQPQSVPANRLG